MSAMHSMPSLAKTPRSAIEQHGHRIVRKLDIPTGKDKAEHPQVSASAYCR
jgi:hypothetical protein